MYACVQHVNLCENCLNNIWAITMMPATNKCLTTAIHGHDKVPHHNPKACPDPYSCSFNRKHCSQMGLERKLNIKKCKCLWDYFLFFLFFCCCLFIFFLWLWHFSKESCYKVLEMPHHMAATFLYPSLQAHIHM